MKVKGKASSSQNCGRHVGLPLVFILCSLFFAAGFFASLFPLFQDASWSLLELRDRTPLEEEVEESLASMAHGRTGDKCCRDGHRPLLVILSFSSFASDEETAETKLPTSSVTCTICLFTVKNVTAVPVTAAASSTGFGTIVGIDDAVTEGPICLRGQGSGHLLASALDIADFHLMFSVVFTEGKHKGSTLEIQGANRYLQQKREVSEVSGTGSGTLEARPCYRRLSLTGR